MSFNSLIEVEHLLEVRSSGVPLVILDCSFELTDSESGRRALPRVIE